MRRLQRAAAAAVRGVIAAACLVGLASTALAQPRDALSQKSPDATEIQSLARTGGSVRVVVLYSVPPGPARANLGTAAEDIPAIVSENHAAQDTILRNHVGDPLTLNAPNRALTRMDITPAFAINATEAEIMALANDPRVVTIEIDRIGAPHLIQSVLLIGMTNAYAAGATGSGWAVAVLDTGVETSHTFLTGQTIAEACFSTTQGTLGSGGSASLCPGGASSSTAVGSGASCNIAWDGCEHGTHVAGIAVGLNSQLQAGQPPNGVAKSGKLIAIKMYSEFNDSSSCPGVSPCVLFFFSDFARALDHVFTIRNSLPGGVKVAAVNLSGGAVIFRLPTAMPLAAVPR